MTTAWKSVLDTCEYPTGQLEVYKKGWKHSKQTTASALLHTREIAGVIWRPLSTEPRTPADNIEMLEAAENAKTSLFDAEPE